MHVKLLHKWEGEIHIASFQSIMKSKYRHVFHSKGKMYFLFSVAKEFYAVGSREMHRTQQVIILVTISSGVLILFLEAL